MDRQIRAFERIADIPWGIILFVFIVIVGAIGVWIDKTLPLNDYVSAVAVGTGLHGIGHGIRTHRRSQQHPSGTP